MNERDFKGVFITKDLYLFKGLSWSEKILLIEIDSLDNPDKKRENGDDTGCFASNGFLAEHLGITEKSVANMVSKLKKEGWIIQLWFDGRHRGLRACFSQLSELKKSETSSENEISFHNIVNQPSSENEISFHNIVKADSQYCESSFSGENLNNTASPCKNNGLTENKNQLSQYCEHSNTEGFKNTVKNTVSGGGGGGGGEPGAGASARGKPPPPTAADNSPPIISEKETRSDYLLRKQLEFPNLNVAAVYQDFAEKCGSIAYPKLKNSRRTFDKWLSEQDEEFEPPEIGRYKNPLTGRELK